jgi:hypothetical protein
VETENGLIRCKLIAVHAGLERNKNVEEQLNFLFVFLKTKCKGIGYMIQFKCKPFTNLLF